MNVASASAAPATLPALDGRFKPGTPKPAEAATPKPVTSPTAPVAAAAPTAPVPTPAAAPVAVAPAPASDPNKLSGTKLDIAA